MKCSIIRKTNNNNWNNKPWFRFSKKLLPRRNELMSRFMWCILYRSSSAEPNDGIPTLRNSALQIIQTLDNKFENLLDEMRHATLKKGNDKTRIDCNSTCSLYFHAFRGSNLCWRTLFSAKHMHLFCYDSDANSSIGFCQR